MIDYQGIIDRFFVEETEEERALREILLVHSRAVAEMALDVCRRHKELNANEDFVYAAAMLHDIGIMQCYAPGIHCHGTEPYIRHGMLGAMMLRSLSVDYEAFARVCERHTGTGLSADIIRRQGLPLPERDFRPETIEEQIICYADKFFSKTHPDQRKTYEKAEQSLYKAGEEGVATFRKWHELFG